MSEPRVSSPSQPTYPATGRMKGKSTDPQPAGPTVVDTRDGLTLKGKGPDPLAAIDRALQFGPLPKSPEAHRTWHYRGLDALMDALGAEKTLREGWRAGRVSGNALSEADSKIRAFEAKLAAAPGHAEARAIYFDGVVKESNCRIDELADLPAPPADKAGKERWLAEARPRLKEAEVYAERVKDAWFRFKGATFDQQADTSGKLHAFRSKVSAVDAELHPAPHRQPGAPDARPPIFGNTWSVQKGMGRDPISSTVGSVVLPIAVTVDVIDLVTKPIQWLNNIAPKK